MRPVRWAPPWDSRRTIKSSPKPHASGFNTTTAFASARTAKKWHDCSGKATGLSPPPDEGFTGRDGVRNRPSVVHAQGTVQSATYRLGGLFRYCRYRMDHPLAIGW